ncbi:MAG: FkbM family methyltransferase [Alphaproteobacteria bacterium]|nr:FkbM family methyltransferase [Alphaproteobacteria bacterium]
MSLEKARAPRARRKLEKKIVKWLGWSPGALRLARRCGIDVSHYTTVHPEMRVERALARLGIDTLLDVGANEGQYARKLRKRGFRGRILSFEPMAGAYGVLAAKAARDPLWTALPYALGAESARRVLHVSGNSVSSSFLPMLASHEAAAPRSAYVGAEEVEIRRLDDVAGELIPEGAKAYLKIDVQGFEHEVLAGAQRFLRRALAVQAEASVVPLYGGQLLVEELIAYMRARDFELFTHFPSFIAPETGQELQLDLVFVSSEGVERLRAAPG